MSRIFNTSSALGKVKWLRLYNQHTATKVPHTAMCSFFFKLNMFGRCTVLVFIYSSSWAGFKQKLSFSEVPTIRTIWCGSPNITCQIKSLEPNTDVHVCTCNNNNIASGPQILSWPSGLHINLDHLSYFLSNH